ncbi:pk1 [Catopsilia pomona nucleopolyhedrovirus]|uniref:non-specific serine/threonine protein kinase n=1 Tax=Catopsilia pomona nucleopolyhedrovirus TaxID=1850906 RepID=A0A172WZ79_9ABAC|nr:pk1 [Catopsilia pomona nucleopolyhedrovirus]ANF29652.1 pk1 [Catopsilia pomona nucleopolyhedrovirus]
MNIVYNNSDDNKKIVDNCLREELQKINNFYDDCETIKPPFAIVDGRFGKMSVLRHRSTNKMYLQKTISMRHFSADEIKVHQLMGEHDNFVKLYFHYSSPVFNVLIMDYKKCRDLYELLPIMKFTTKRVANIVRQLCCALNDLHKIGYVHNDIKLENVLYSELLDHVYVCDYGLCKRENTKAIVHDGTLEYFSPEKFCKMPYSSSFDWYAVGILTYKLFTDNRHPFEKVPGEELEFDEMRRGQRYDDINVLNEVHDTNARNFIYQLTVYNYKRRLVTFNEIIKHKFIN